MQLKKNKKHVLDRVTLAKKKHWLYIDDRILVFYSTKHSIRGNSTFADAKQAILERLREEGKLFKKFYFVPGLRLKTSTMLVIPRWLRKIICKCWVFSHLWLARR